LANNSRISQPNSVSAKQCGWFRLTVLMCVLLAGSIATRCASNNSKHLSPEQTALVGYFSNAQMIRIESVISEVLQKSGAPGALVGIVGATDTPIIIAKGYSNISSSTPMEGDLKFRIASNTKTYTAMTVLQLADDPVDPKIDLDKTLEYYLPGSGIAYADVITVRQLLNHTSGVASYNEIAAFLDIWLVNPLYEWTKTEIMDIIRSGSPDFYPGTAGKWKYSDSNYFLLGLIIEKVTGSSAESVITAMTIDKVGLSSTVFPTTSEAPTPYCTGYKMDSSGNLVEVIKVHPSGPWTGGAMTSDIRDLAKWVKVLGNGSLLSEMMKAECFTFVPAVDGSTYGLGLMEINGLRGHTGTIQGHETAIFYSTQKDLAVVVMLNRCNEENYTGSSIEINIKIFRILAPELF